MEPVEDSPSPTISDLLRLQELGILSKNEVRRLVLQSLPPDVQKRGVENSQKKRDDGYSTPPSKIRKRNRTPLFFDAEETGAAVNDNNNGHENVDPEVPTKKKKTRGRSSPTTTRLRRLAKDITRQRFLQQCMDIGSLLFYQTGAGEMIDKLLFARAAQHCKSALYRAYPESLHGISGKKLMDVISWQVVFVCALIYIVFVYLCINI